MTLEMGKITSFGLLRHPNLWDTVLFFLSLFLLLIPVDEQNIKKDHNLAKIEAERVKKIML